MDAHKSRPPTAGTALLGAATIAGLSVVYLVYVLAVGIVTFTVTALLLVLAQGDDQPAQPTPVPHHSVSWTHVSQKEVQP